MNKYGILFAYTFQLSIVPNRVIQLAYGNVGWRKYVSLFISSCCGTVLSFLVMCISVITSAWDLGFWIYSLIWESQAEDSEAKPPVWDALRSILSHVAEANVNQSALGPKPEWTHSVQCLSRSSMYMSLVTNQWRDNFVIHTVGLYVQMTNPFFYPQVKINVKTPLGTYVYYWEQHCREQVRYFIK
jgi:hypothetical protein